MKARAKYAVTLFERSCRSSISYNRFRQTMAMMPRIYPSQDTVNRWKVERVLIALCATITGDRSAICRQCYQSTAVAKIAHRLWHDSRNECLLNGEFLYFGVCANESKRTDVFVSYVIKPDRCKTKAATRTTYREESTPPSPKEWYRRDGCR